MNGLAYVAVEGYGVPFRAPRARDVVLGPAPVDIDTRGMKSVVALSGEEVFVAKSPPELLDILENEKLSVPDKREPPHFFYLDAQHALVIPELRMGIQVHLLRKAGWSVNAGELAKTLPALPFAPQKPQAPPKPGVSLK